jgi:hypothetical protein
MIVGYQGLHIGMVYLAKQMIDVTPARLAGPVNQIDIPWGRKNNRYIAKMLTDPGNRNIVEDQLFQRTRFDFHDDFVQDIIPDYCPFKPEKKFILPDHPLVIGRKIAFAHAEIINGIKQIGLSQAVEA